MKILYLYSEVMGYTLAVIDELIRLTGAEVHLVHWDKKKNTPFAFKEIDGIKVYQRSELDKQSLISLVDELNPRFVYVSGRMDKEYLSAAKYAKRKGIATISGFDAQWKGTFRNRVQSLLGKWLYRSYFDYLWVCGPYQYEFAKHLGYRKDQIVWNLYSADTTKFSVCFKEDVFEKRFVFVGRLVEAKAIDVLIKAFKKSKEYFSHDWELAIVGNGPLKNNVPIRQDISVFEFMQPDELAEFMKRGGVFVLPSRHEPWGVVLHEFVCAGYPLICSDEVGAASVFLKQGFNGESFKSGSQDELAKLMVRFALMSTQEIKSYRLNSVKLSGYITPEISAKSLLSKLKVYSV